MTTRYLILRSIQIYYDQAVWLHQHPEINFSALVRDALRQVIRDRQSNE